MRWHDAFGKLNDLFKGAARNQKFFVKPNFCVGKPSCSGVTSDVELVGSIVRALKDNGASRVYIGESAIYKTAECFDWLDVYRLSKLGATVVNLDKDDWVKVANPSCESFMHFHLPKSLLDCDAVVSVPKIKTHCQTGVTLSVKNFLGCIPRGDRKLAHITNISAAIVSVFQLLRTTKRLFSVVDGGIALQGKRGPIAGLPVDLGIVLFGTDLVAVDSVCCRIMAVNALTVAHLAQAFQLGLGQIEDIAVVEDGICLPSRPFILPDFDHVPAHSSSLLFHYVGKVFVKYPFVSSPQVCVLCERCLNVCPVRAVELNGGQITFDYRKCIGCLCCVEVCRHECLDYKTRYQMVYNCLRFLWRHCRVVGR
jgi:uncharacterized protein (DUF362 family)/Pyruvate/2-oxoacid:ferredoxin oxidoreductase delta subunit